jgi:hypothetical protein
MKKDFLAQVTCTEEKFAGNEDPMEERKLDGRMDRWRQDSCGVVKGKNRR